eukprot:NODE_133_length_16612_cov_1.402531.p4 type:complete len:191 gc:universal NODE_133_length_16612_cov_1.402531:8492-7920(-)
MGRKTQSQVLDNLVCDDIQLKRLGRWEKSRLTSNYLLNLPIQAIKLCSGATTINGSYNLNRNKIIPPPDLQSLVFPELDQVQQWFTNDPYTGMLCDVLKWMRVVFLQDTALLIHDNDYQHHLLFEHPIFSDTRFISFSKALNQQEMVYEALPIKTTAFLEQAAPEICQKLKQQHQLITSVHQESSTLKGK